MMKRWMKCIVAVGMLGTLFVAVRTSLAGEYHTDNYLICSDCHTMHYSQQHTYTGQPGQGDPPLGGAGPYKYLLRNSANELCKSCHDGLTEAPDVVRTNTGTHVRQAGALNELGDSDAGPKGYAEWKGHTLGSTATAPGGTLSNAEGLQCVSCHHQHGYAGSATDVKGNSVTSAYRNLKAMSISGMNKNVSYAKGTNDLAKDVFLRGWTLGDVANNYSIANVDFNEPATNNSGIGTWCMGCHTNFHGKKGDPNMGGGGTGGTEWLRHPTADSNIGQSGVSGHSSLSRFGGRLNRVKVMSPGGDWGAQGAAWTSPPTDLTPTCITCHKAHGNANPFGLIYMAGVTAGGVTEEGDTEGTIGADSGARRLCMQCHVQGGT